MSAEDLIYKLPEQNCDGEQCIEDDVLVTKPWEKEICAATPGHYLVVNGYNSRGKLCIRVIKDQ